MQAVIDAVAARLREGDESSIRIPDISEATGVNYGSVYHHFGSRENVIDEAYAKIFSDLALEDISLIRQALSAHVVTLSDFISGLRPLVDGYSLGGETRIRRMLRTRCIAASANRPNLELSIRRIQTLITNELVLLVERGQELGFVRRDLTARAVATLVQVMIYGRLIDDLSLQPLSEVELEFATASLMSGLLNIQ